MDEDEFEIGATDTGQQRSVRAPRGPQLRRPPRGVTVGLIVACVVVVTAGLALASVPNLSGRVDVLLHGTPTATPRIPAGGNLLYAVNAVHWGALTIDGKAVSFDELTSTGYPAPTFLTRGIHTVVYRADPFPVLHCHLSVPASKADTCPLDHTYKSPDSSLASAARALDLAPALDSLSAGARADLLRAVSAYLTIQGTPVVVHPGDRYVNAAHEIVVAEQAMSAVFTQTLDPNAPNSSCNAFCAPLPNPNLNADPIADFVINVPVVDSFTYRTSTGETLATDAPIAASAEVPNGSMVALVVTWNGAWQVSLPSPSYSPACVAATQALSSYEDNPNENYQAIFSIGNEIAAPNPADGCVFRLGGGGYVGTPTASEYLHILYRFGVVLAVEDFSGYYLLDKLPPADDAEIALAWQIDATQPYS